MMNVFGQRSKSSNVMWLLEKQFRERARKGPQIMCLFGQRSKSSNVMWLLEKQFRERARKRSQVMWLFGQKQDRERPQVKQERGDKKEAPGDVVVCLDKKQEDRDAPGEARKRGQERGPR